MYSPLKLKNKYFSSRSGENDLQTDQDSQPKCNSVESIHNKLKSETENMLRWKISMEVALDQKNRQLGESKKLLYVLRKNLLDQQLLSEQLSQTVLKERNHRTLLQEKVETTRHLCDALKQNQHELQVSVKGYSFIKERLSKVQEDAVSGACELTKKFEDLKIKHESFVQDLSSKASQEISQLRSDGINLKEELQLQTDKVNALNESAISSCEQLQKNHDEIAHLEKLLNETQTDKENLACELDKIKSKLEEVEENLRNQLKEFETQTINLKVLLASEKKLLMESKNEFEEAVGKIKYLKNCNNTLEGCKEELTEQLQIIKQKKGQVEQELIQTSDKLENYTNKAKLSETTLKGQIIYLEGKIKEASDKLEEEKIEKEEMVSLYDKLKSDYETQKNSLDGKDTVYGKLLQAKEEEINEVKIQNDEYKVKITAMEETINSHENKSKLSEVRVADLVSELESVKMLLQENDDKLKVLQLNVDEKSMENEKLKTNAQDLEDSILNLTENLNLVKIEYEQENQSLNSQIQVLEERNKEMIDTASNNSNIVKTLLEKLQALEETKLEKSDSVTALKNELEATEASLKTFQMENVSLKDTIITTQEQLEEITNQFNVAKKELGGRSVSYESLTKTVEDLQQELKDTRKSLDENLLELTTTKNSLNLELKKSEKFKSRIDNQNEKLKNKESDSKATQSKLNLDIENLQTENKKLNELHENCKNNLADVQKKLEESEFESENRIKEMMNLMDSCKKDRDSEILAKQIETDQIKDELNDLQQLLERQQRVEEKLDQEKTELKSNLKTAEQRHATLSNTLAEKVCEMDKLKGVLNVLSNPTPVHRQVSNPRPVHSELSKTSKQMLKTPSPSSYLPLMGNKKAGGPIPSRNSSNVRTPRLNFEKRFDGSPVLAFHPLPPSINREKRVTFSSPVSHQQRDSDSSVDAYSIEMGSDADDKFDSIFRSTMTRKHISPKVKLPQANIQPMIRHSKSKTLRTPSNNQQESSKKFCGNRSAVNTYSSPYATKKKEIIDLDG